MLKDPVKINNHTFRHDNKKISNIFEKEWSLENIFVTCVIIQ